MKVGDILWRAEYDKPWIKYHRWVVDKLTPRGAWIVSRERGKRKWIKRGSYFVRPTPDEALASLKERALSNYAHCCRRQREAWSRCSALDIPLEHVQRARERFDRELDRWASC